jgi:hypothetical protein
MMVAMDHDELAAAHQARGSVPQPETPASMTICDSQGGMLTVDLASREAHWLVAACHHLLTQPAARSASIIKVHAGDDVYLLARRGGDGAHTEVVITNLFDPSERVALSRDLAEIVAALLERLCSARAAS